VRHVFKLLLMIFIALNPAVWSNGQDSLILRSSIVTHDKIWQGQRVIINIDVLGSEGWAQIKKTDHIEIPGAYIIKTETQGARLSETINGTGYTGQRYEFSIFPQQSGTLIIPAVPVEIQISTWGSAASKKTIKKLTEPLEITVNKPPPANDITNLISSEHLTIKQSWDKNPANLKVGDAFKRTVTITALNTPGMLLPPIKWDKNEILDIYPHTPEVKNSIADDMITGSRVESITYVCQQSGSTTLAAIKIPWWNPQKEKFIYAELEPLTLHIKENPTIKTNRLQDDSTRHLPKESWMIIALILLAITIMSVFSFHYRNPIRKLLKTYLNKIIPPKRILPPLNPED